MSSPKTPPCQKTAATATTSSAFNIFRGFSRKQKKIVNVSVIGGEGVGKSAFVVRFLTRRFIGDYSSSLSCAYPHTLSLDNAPVSVVVWDSPAISTASVHTMCEQLDTVISWSDVILILYSVTDLASYHTANIAHKYITSRHQYRKECNTDPCLILVGNKNDLWQDREVATDLACQEAEANGYTNYHEITTKESLDQVRIVFAEGIRRGLASGEHVTRRQRLRQRTRTISVDNTDEHSPSGDSEEMIASPKQSTINIMNNIKRKIMSHHHKISNEFGDEPRFKLTMRTRSKTFSEGRACGDRRQIIRISKEAEEEREEDVLIEEASSINNRQRKMSVFEPRSAST